MRDALDHQKRFVQCCAKKVAIRPCVIILPFMVSPQIKDFVPRSQLNTITPHNPSFAIADVQDPMQNYAH
jgi:hypothetical protein